MTKKKLYVLAAGLGLTAFVAAALVVGAFQSGSGGDADLASDAPNLGLDAGVLEEAASTAPGSPNEGIEVHGHWTIEVREPDGALVSHYEFENALLASGALSLGSFLSRQETLGIWRVVLYGTPLVAGDAPCLDTGTPSECTVIESGSTLSGDQISKTLTVDVPTSGSNQGKLVLSGNFTAGTDGNVGSVVTAVDGCAPTIAPASNCEGSIHFMTQTILGSAVTVANGQQVLAAVVISFS